MTLRVGLDLVAVESVAESLRGDHAEHYLERVYTAREVDDCRGARERSSPSGWPPASPPRRRR